MKTLFCRLENHLFIGIMKYHFSIFAQFLLEAVEAKLFRKLILHSDTLYIFSLSFELNQSIVVLTYLYSTYLVRADQFSRMAIWPPIF